ncbi:fatty acid desaturase-domain-containing protein [Blastocladiella britannica]|nr:fatty acid desaturase-domain-containing protein [Blastocladiella britannica]
MAKPAPISWTVNWPQATFLFVTPCIALWATSHIELQLRTFIWAFIYYFVTGLGITAGYHRLWAHKSYDAVLPYQIWMALAGVGAVEGSIRWWSRGHRAHHRYTDTDKDPYNAHRGLFWAHIGWMLVKPSDDKRAALGRVEMQDLDRDSIVKFQHKYYVPLALFMAFAFPSLIAGLGWGDWVGGFFYAGVARLVCVHHATFCVNSLAHYLGEATYDDIRSPRDHWVTALATFGEGMHNFHHEFPNDYRNAVLWHQYDPTKWLIYVCSVFGLTYNLKQFPSNEVIKGKLLMSEKKNVTIRHSLDWGIDVADLPVWDRERYTEELKLNPAMLVIDGVAHDVSLFIQDHPGGVGFIRAYMGQKDATAAFNGGVYKHATAARNLMTRLRVARVEGMTSSAASASSAPSPIL